MSIRIIKALTQQIPPLGVRLPSCITSYHVAHWQWTPFPVHPQSQKKILRFLFLLRVLVQHSAILSLIFVINTCVPFFFFLMNTLSRTRSLQVHPRKEKNGLAKKTAYTSIDSSSTYFLIFLFFLKNKKK